MNKETHVISSVDLNCTAADLEELRNKDMVGRSPFGPFFITLTHAAEELRNFAKMIDRMNACKHKMIRHHDDRQLIDYFMKGDLP